MTFASLGLIDPILRALKDAGYNDPTPIQTQTIPLLLADRDILGCAQTGTGKTASFALPILQYMDKNPLRLEPRTPRVLVLAPTRELAAQIDESFRTYGKYLPFRSGVLFGGVGYDKQIRMLRQGVHVLVATPGRLLDLMAQKAVTLRDLEVLVLDEADRMLDMGFVHDVRRILREIPKDRQTLFFSATMPPEIRRLADDILHDPAEVAVTPVATTAEKITQSVFMVEKAHKRTLLLHLLKDKSVTRSLVFTRTKHAANKVTEHLEKAGIHAAAIHGNKSQGARERALAGFKSGKVGVLVATDIAARGIDVDGITHVINFDLPNEPESYVHRIGRTARAGASGIAWSFCDREERAYLRSIERIIKMRVDIVTDQPYHSASVAAGEPGNERPEEDRPRGGGGRRQGGGGQRGYGGGGGGRSGGGGGGGGNRGRGGPSRPSQGR